MRIWIKNVNVVDANIARRNKFRLLLQAWNALCEKKNHGDLNTAWQKIRNELGWTGKEEMEAYKEFSALMKESYMQTINAAKHLQDAG